MNKYSKFFNRIYRVTDPDEIQSIYSEWASSYDNDVDSHGYVTPDRCAQALARVISVNSSPILDVGCGTGISGKAFIKAGFCNIYGTDLNAEMLAIAHSRNIYVNLSKTTLLRPLPVDANQYAVIAAIGVIGSGAAPLEFLQEIMRALRPGAITIFSFNDHTLAEPKYVEYVEQMTKTNEFELLVDEYGPHMIKLGLKSRIFAIRKTAIDQ